MVSGGVARDSSRATPHPDVIVTATVMPGFEPFRSDRFTVQLVDCRNLDDNLAYARGLAEAWATDRTVVNIEADLQRDDDLIGELVDCPHPRCAWAYLVYAASGIHNPPAYPFTRGNPGPWIDKGDEWADWAAPGFIKVAPEARVEPLPVDHWHEVEQHTNQCAPGRWHIHWPAVEHYHQ